jgi:hypothetical protein
MPKTARHPAIKPKVKPKCQPRVSRQKERIAMPTIIELIGNRRGAAFVTLTTNTEPDMYLKGNPFRGKVRKICRINGQINFWYDRAVVARLEKEGKHFSSFFAGESWHTPVIREDGTLTPFAKHKTNDTLYLRFRVISVLDVRYVDLAGNPIEKEAIIEWLKPASEYKNQGTDDPIRFLVYKLSSIVALTLDGETQIVDAPENETRLQDVMEFLGVRRELELQTQPQNA